MAAKKLRVGFIGLGHMGYGMALNILSKGFPLAVMAHRKRQAIDDLVRRGAREVANPAELAECSDLVILCVSGAAEVDSLVRGDRGLASHGRPGLIILDCTTSAPATLLKLAGDYAQKQIEFADGPLGRSPAEALKGVLSIMIGGEAVLLERIRPVLSTFATTIQHAGALGDGHRLKLVNNLVSLGYAALYSEALVMARKAGLGTEAFDQLLRSSRMHCAFYDTFMGWALEGDAKRHPFALDTAFHTITDAVDYARSLGLNGRLAASVCDIYRSAVAQGDGAEMLPTLPRSVGAANGVELRPLRGPKD
jgi:3-hydroxyisobutyrate dehydrogenase-like beta-hydroxyacid dehydrogenase